MYHFDHDVEELVRDIFCEMHPNCDTSIVAPSRQQYIDWLDFTSTPGDLCVSPATHMIFVINAGEQAPKCSNAGSVVRQEGRG